MKRHLSEATRGGVFIRKCVAPIPALIIPNGCSTVSRPGASSADTRFYTTRVFHVIFDDPVHFQDSTNVEQPRRTCSMAQEKRPGMNPGPSSFRLRVDLIVHAAHATARHSRGPTVLLRPFGNHGFRGDE